MVDDHPEKADSGEDDHSRGSPIRGGASRRGRSSPCPGDRRNRVGWPVRRVDEQDWVDEVVRETRSGRSRRSENRHPPPYSGPTVEDSEDEVGSNEELVEARTQLDRLFASKSTCSGSGACESETCGGM